MAHTLPTSFPLTLYIETLVKDITTRPLLPWAVPTETERIPDNIYPEYISPYPSLLPQEKMNLDFAKRDKEYRLLDNYHLHNDVGDRVLYLWRLEPKQFFAATHPAVRVLETTQSTKNYENPFLINAGPRTTSATPEAGQAVFPIARLTFEQRQLEQIAWNVGVVKPDGEFNCQNWAAAVLAVAVARGMLEEGSVQRILNEALKGVPTGFLPAVPLTDA